MVVKLNFFLHGALKIWEQFPVSRILNELTFLNAPSHLYKRVCPFVRPSVPSYFQTRTRRILCRVFGLVLLNYGIIFFT